MLLEEKLDSCDKKVEGVSAATCCTTVLLPERDQQVNPPLLLRERSNELGGSCSNVIEQTALETWAGLKTASSSTTYGGGRLVLSGLDLDPDASPDGLLV